MFRVDMVDSRRNERSYQRDLRIILAGPGLNFLLAALCFPIYLLLPYQWFGMFFLPICWLAFLISSPLQPWMAAQLACNFIRKAGRKESDFWANFFPSLY